MATKKQIIQNIDVLIVAIEAEPNKKFNLNQWQQEADCGTIHCTAGLACTMPYFKNKGWKWKEDWHIQVPAVNGLKVNSGGADKHFGENSFNLLFEAAWQGDLDSAHPAYNTVKESKIKHKDLALWRLRVRKAMLEFA